MIFSTRFGVQTPRTVAVFAAFSMLVALLPVFFAPLPALADHSGTDPLAKTSNSASNPDLDPSCGINVLFVLDETGSMGDEEEKLVDAVQAFRASLDGTLSKIGIIEFSSLPESANTVDPNPGTPQSARDVTGGYLSPASATLTGYTQEDGDATGNTGSYNANGYTSWQEALWKASQYSTADLLIFFTDGDPNTVDGDSHVSNSNSLGYGNAPAGEAAEFAAAYANIIKGKGTHILGMGLGFSAGQAARLAQVSGPQGVSLPGGTFNVSTTDYVTFSNPNDIATALEEISDQLCTTTFEVTKWVADDPTDTFDSSTGIGSGFVKASGWEFDLTDPVVTGGFDWVTQPPGFTSGGSVEFAWQNDVRNESASVNLTETEKTGWNVLGGNCVVNGDTVVLDNTDNDWAISNIPDRATVKCDVYNTPGFLTLTKDVENDDGGTADPNDFTLNASGPTNISGKSGSGTVTGAPVVGGNYTLSEDPKTGYTQVGDWDCDTTVTGGNSVTIVAGAHVLCTVTNTDQPPTLTLLKVVNHTYGGDAVASDWTLSAKQGPTTLSGPSGVSGDIPGGTYDLSETGPSGYSLVGWLCDNGDDAGTVTLNSGDDVTCTATNDSDPASLTLIKKVADNDFGATADATDWTLTADGPGSNDLNGAGGDSDSTLPAGQYFLGEFGGPDGWTGDWECVGGSYNSANDSVTIGIGESAVCTITNTPTQPTLTLIKDLILGEGANETTDDFLLKAEGPITIQGNSGKVEATDAPVHVGEYTLSESGPAGYSQVGGWICIGGSQDGGKITLAVGGSATCTVTNASDPAKLTLVKEVINDDGGQGKPGDFQLTLNGDNAPQGENAVVPNTEYTLSESPVSGYSFAGIVCKDGDETVPHPVTLDEGQEVTCTITNDDQPGVITVVKQFAHETNAQPDDFDLTLNDEDVDSGEVNFVPGNDVYTVDETLLEGWVQVSLTCVEDGQGETPVDHPVALANGQAVVCTIVNGEIPTVTVEKVAIGDDEANFDFTGDLGDFSFTEEGGSETWEVEPGEYNVFETPAEFWALTGIECDGGATGDLNNAEASFELGYGEKQECTFTNEQLPESIEVIATGVCDGGAPYLKWIVNPVNFDGTEVTITWLGIDPADPLYQSTGNPMQGMMLWPGAVLDGDGNLIDWPGWISSGGGWSQGDDGYQNTVPTATVMFTVKPDIVVQVAYLDCGGPPARIIVEKQVTGDASQDFEFVFNTGGFELDDSTLSHGDQGVSGDLEPGDGYSVSESIPNGWEQVSAICDNGSSPNNISLSTGETVTCMFVNTITLEVLETEVEPVEVLPFTGLYADEMAGLALALTVAGMLAVIAARRRREDGLDG